MRNERDFPSAGGASARQGVGARLPRKEDDRLMRGRGQYVADIRLSGLQDVAFVRSPLAHARLRGIAVPDRYRGNVFTAADLAGIRPVHAAKNANQRRFASAVLADQRVDFSRHHVEIRGRPS